VFPPTLGLFSNKKLLSKMAKVKSKKQNKSYASPFKNYWNKQNYYLLFFGILTVLVGFILMAQEPWDSTLSLSISPIILLIAYIIIFPLAILYRRNKPSLNQNVSSEN
jgi:ATP/ADP translocase